MITMIPADEEARRQLGITDPALRVMVLVNGKAIDGHILFVIRETEMELLSTDVTDALLQEGLVRAALNYGARRAVETAFSTTPALKSVLRTLRFSEDGERLSVSVPEFFDRGCCCHGKFT